jgi:hypothetical protein
MLLTRGKFMTCPFIFVLAVVALADFITVVAKHI